MVLETTIKISRETRDKLKELRLSDEESYNLTIIRLIEFYEKNS